MSQKTQETMKKETYIQSGNLDRVFNPSDYTVVYSENPTKEDLYNEKKKKAEDDLYNEVVRGLKADMENLDMNITYSQTKYKIIVGINKHPIMFARLTPSEMQ